MKNREDEALLEEIRRRFEQKDALIAEMEEMTRTLLALNKKAEEADSVKTKFLSLIKNELNNPLSSLLALSAKLAQKRDSGQFDAILKMLHGELCLMDFQLGNIFAASDIQAGKNASFYTQVDMGELLREAAEKLRYLVEEKEIELILDDRCGRKVHADRRKMLLIIVNLLSNACQYSYAGRRVWLSCTCSGEEIVVRVEDEGEGVGEALRGKMHEPFVQYTSGAARPVQGLGLGLSIVNAMLESEYGTLDYEPKEQGSVFTAVMPCGERAEHNENTDDGFFEL